MTILDIDTVTCPACQGNKQIPNKIFGINNGEIIVRADYEIDCPWCEASGRVPLAVAEAVYDYTKTFCLCLHQELEHIFCMYVYNNDTDRWERHYICNACHGLVQVGNGS